MSASLLLRAADAMTAEADRLEAVDSQSTSGPWAASPRNAGQRRPGWVHNDKTGTAFDSIATNAHPSDAVLIAQRRNTISRDIATLRATASLLLQAAAGPTGLASHYNHHLAVARAFLEVPA